MAVPAEIRAVPRPVNTIVDDNGSNSPKRYAVRQRGTTRYVAGGNPQPHNGKVIGHIIDGKYVPIDDEKKAAASPDMLSYGASALVKSVTNDIVHDLLDVYDPSDVYAMMSIATLRVIKPSIASNRMATHYNRTFVCRDYPGAALSKNSITDLFQRIGMDGNKRKRFYQLRLEKTAADHHIAIDGMLKQDNSKVNDLFAFSRKARVRGCCEDRGLLELVFNRYKSDECLDHTNGQGNFSVIGSEFINFLSTVATCRILKKAEVAGLLENRRIRKI